MGIHTAVRSHLISSSDAVNTTWTEYLHFDPKFIFMWWSGASATGIAQASSCHGFGWGYDASNRKSITHYSTDNVATSAEGGSALSDVIMHTTDALNATTGVLDIDAWQTQEENSSTHGLGAIRFIIDDQFPSSIYVCYLIVGGDDITNVAMGTYDCPIVTGNYTPVTGLGFRPNLLMITSYAAPSLSIGFGVYEGGSLSSYSQIYRPRGGRNPSEVYTYSKYNEIWNDTTGSSINKTDLLVSMDSGGFTLNHTLGTSVRTCNYLAVGTQGDQSNFILGQDYTELNTNDQTFSIYEPQWLKGALFRGHNQSQSTAATLQTSGTFGIGAVACIYDNDVVGENGVGYEYACTTKWNEHGISPTDVAATYHAGTGITDATGRVYQKVSTSEALDAYMLIDGWTRVGQQHPTLNEGTFTFHMGVADSIQAYIPYLLIGSIYSASKTNIRHESG